MKKIDLTNYIINALYIILFIIVFVSSGFHFSSNLLEDLISTLVFFVLFLPIIIDLLLWKKIPSLILVVFPVLKSIYIVFISAYLFASSYSYGWSIEDSLTTQSGLGPLVLLSTVVLVVITDIIIIIMKVLYKNSIRNQIVSTHSKAA